MSKIGALGFSLGLFLFSCQPLPQGARSTPTESISPSVQPSAALILESIDEKSCHEVIEIDKNNYHYKSFERSKVGEIMPLMTVFKNCSFKDEDIATHTFSYFNNNKGQTFIFSKITEEQSKPVRTTASPSYCGFYFVTGQTDISLIAETELKNGEKIKSLPFTLHLDSDHVKYCETPGNPMIKY
ncbi:hypothetical protein COW36_10055 [bacterium (Candidatus Blackallbacteria) CG17_big_fil_post_rev_8_21_14_2_50_48_46]|uniref:Lipoprotein n=1 Tax=bacterium (Candidatus Blackallbacteria) CG17_big_fil_post_rev_8_21_14_2_50_48_46 TaxID=2014261 RepID=A0A2M7G572_9BACT|nr:MAG: hypothetical protein COW64_07195 [bacterium (Candidatus Blackallbacteria) CG18_big_fil_WC_8_21_14_2_50_49_26]PIW17105.1 MAG: hypothetical protein COW36_10055 [bacterium (Candidatus Blackallbacteria) CG17_big_fil_post_rev_8_21_14_2_50_48_46]PIW49177.1 MAG: hypothetical protein COW20_06670 [bacterium (Candidatus Blackallbacteria) CG13_big_fil_rev_8_21_14_2_50_49_14]